MGELLKFGDTPLEFDVTVLSNNSDDDEIYEKIEAPKFVDFSALDRSLQVDDRSWFCLREGCDLKHEEDINPETLYKDFVLRVMAARSPNLRYRRQATRANLKCPQSEPAKSSKRRLSRLTVVTSISQKLADAKVKVHPICKFNLTPKGTAKKISISGKALTTPRNKKSFSNRDPFRSVQNVKTACAMPRNRVVAKALVFNSPKKAERKKNLIGCQTPVTALCSEMNKLEITSQAKPCKTSSSASCQPRKCTPASQPLKSKLYDQIAKNLIEVSGDSKEPKTKSMRRMKKKSKGKLQNVLDLVPQESSVNDVTDMGVDEKSENRSIDVHSVSGDSKSNVEHLVAIEEENLSAAEAMQEEHIQSATVINSGHSLEEEDANEIQENKLEVEENYEGNTLEESVKSHPEELDSKDNDVPSTQPLGKDEGIETNGSDDKENAYAENSDSNHNDENSQRNINHSEHSEHLQKVNGKEGKPLKGSSTAPANGEPLEVKHRKTKLTNPKPFRLRTDERGNVREAKMEKRLLLAPLREIKLGPKVADGVQERHENEIELKEKSRKHCTRENNNQEVKPTETGKLTKKMHYRQVKSKYLDTSKCAAETKMAATTTQKLRKVEDGEENAAQKLQRRTTKSQLLREQLVRPRRVFGTREPKPSSLVSLVRLGIIKETSSTVSRPMEVKIETVGPISATTKPAGRCTSRGRRPTTVAKEPNFHKIHIPKSCTRTPEKVASIPV
ncbi:hypothetical protein C5167_024471 [Papaver somniferum]|uniref:Uncharacterized protein n=1 Tax=Papaver somniferum TaxID=3469 RepID=A0A4Y7JRQ4_PAPSO|nr:uncharacterized protein LOC113278042 [Papaver somniferum]RZC62712.1 hypothetical protein C5167_024471 [Papaver somniferum]